MNPPQAERSRSARWPLLLLVVFSVALVLAPSAGAKRGVLGSVVLPDPFPIKGATRTVPSPGELADPAGSWNGAGDIYTGGFRLTGEGDQINSKGGYLEQVSPTGALKRAWGRDVVLSGPGDADETQAVRVSATGGTFTLGFARTAAGGTGNMSPGSTLVTGVKTASGAFAVGQSIEAVASTNDVLAPGTTIAAVDVVKNTLTLSQPATATEFLTPILLATDSLSSATTAPIPFDAPASGPGSVEDALNALPSVSADGGSVSVSGGPGDGAGSAPYIVSFDGASLAGIDQPLLSAGGSSLTGAVSAYTTNPGDTGFEICEPANGDICKDPADRGNAGGAYNSTLVKSATRPGALGENAPTTRIDQASGDIYAHTDLRRVNVYSSTGQFRRALGWDVVRQGPGDSNVDEVQELTVTAAAGTYRLTLNEGEGAQATVSIPFDGSAAQIETAIEALFSLKANNGSVSVTGANPYTIAFGGGYGGDEVPQLTVSPSAAASVATVQDGGAPEVCAPDDACKIGAVGDTPGMVPSVFEEFKLAPVGAPNQGNLLFTGPARMEELDPTGDFVRAFGWDVVESGPSQVAAPDETQQVTVDADGGTFRLSFQPFGVFVSGATTLPIPFDAPASGPGSVEDALNALPSTGGITPPVSVTVTGGPGGTNPYEVTFGGSLSEDGVPRITSQSFQNSLAGPRTVALENATGGTFTLGFDGSVTEPIAFDAGAATVQVTLEALPTVGTGNVSVSGPPGGPWQVTFTGALAGTGKSLSANGSALTGASPTATVQGPSVAIATLTQGGAFEVCRPGAGDVCRPGSMGPGLGQFSGGDRGLGDAIGNFAVDSSGAIYTLENASTENNALEGNRRVQKFTPAGGLDLTPSSFGVDETQQLTVNAGAGQFRLSAVDLRGATGTVGDAKSNVLPNFKPKTGEFRVGEQITSGVGLPYGTTITAVGPDTLTVSHPSCGCVSQGPLADAQIIASLHRFTPDLPYNASAAAVEAAINDLGPIEADGSSVSVSGPDGGPYTLTYDGGPASHADFAPLGTAQGTTPLSGGAGPDANQAVVSTLGDGGPSGRSTEIFPFGDFATGIDVLPNGDPIVTKRSQAFSADCAAGFPFDLSPLEFSFQQSRTQEFTSDGLDLVGMSPACVVDPDLFFDGKDNFAGSGNRFSFQGEVGTDPELSLDPVAVSAGGGGAEISGTVDPNGAGPIPYPNPELTRYAVDYRRVGDPDWIRWVSRVPVGSGSSPVPFSVGISGLLPKTEYEIRVRVLKPNGFLPLIQVTPPFLTSAGKPRIEAPYSENVTAGSADLKAAVNPSGAETTYRFEYGTTTNYGQSTPPVNIGDGGTLVPVQAHLTGLDPVVYHFRVVATNSEGTAASVDQTFNFYPEPCPNATARQQTGATRLPDCRAYELVSPAKMGSVVLTASGPVATHATSPSRFAYGSGLGVLPGPWNPPNAGDTYVATRTPTGWQTQYVGVEIHEIGDASGSLRGNLALDRFLQTSLNTDRTGDSPAPYMFDAEGNQLGRLPTNLDEIPGGDAPSGAGGFAGDQLFSDDGRHFFYSSVNVPLAPGGLTSGAGSVYRNDIVNETVEIVSKTEAGADIPPAPGPANLGHFMLLFDASRDGSHVLMGAPSACPGSLSLQASCPRSPAVLYMRAGTTSYDISEGHGVKFEGMAADGSKVYFTSAEPLTGDDADTSIDLYMWSEAGDSLTRISAAGDPVGNTDGCNAGWIEACGVEVVSTPETFGSVEPGVPNELFSHAPESAVADENGAIYFYSPEQLVGTEGVPGRRNLFAYRDGNLHFVAALEPEKALRRIQVSADGRFVAFITRSQLTSYDNTGIGGACSYKSNFNQTSGPQCLEMYVNDLQTGELVCASCVPTGAPPSHEVLASRNGSFMTDDGRAFFATKEALIPADTDGLTDVYEFVHSRPQLITTGTASQEAQGGTLVGVSADGTDVYFATLETLTRQDENGFFLKFYDARTGGGFAVAPQVAPCEAADECHGTGSSEPPPPQLSNTADLGAGGNALPKKHKKHKKKKHKKKKHKHKKGNKHQKDHRNQTASGDRQGVGQR